MVKYVKASTGAKYITDELRAAFENSANKIEQRIYNIFNKDLTSILINNGVWYTERAALPKYALDYLKKYIKDNYGVEYMYDKIPVNASLKLEDYDSGLAEFMDGELVGMFTDYKGAKRSVFYDKYADAQEGIWHDYKIKCWENGELTEVPEEE